MIRFVGKKSMILIDLFSGIGGFAKGFELAGFTFEHHYFSEIDKHAIANYKYNFKHATYAGDIKSISGTELRQRHPNSKFIITFGFPCQDLSVAGKGLGFDGKRSILFFEAIRIIQEINPEVFIFENVKGLLGHNNGKTFEIVLRTIADIGIYECEWQLVNTRWVLPQNRERIFFIGHLAGKSKPRVFPITEADFRATERESKTPIIRAITGGGHSGGHHSGMTLICDSGHKLEKRQIMAPLRSNTGSGHGNYIIQQLKRGFNKGNNFKVCPTLSSNSFEQNNFIIQMPNHGHKAQRSYTDFVPSLLSNMGTSGDNVPYVIQKTGGYCTTYKENEIGTLQGGGASVMDKVPNVIVRAPLKFPGRNGKKTVGDYAFTIDGANTGGLKINDTIRRLTEIECERLQGFPDNWAQYGDYDGKIKEICKTQRYKMLGNAVTVDILKIIVEKLKLPISQH